jgi:hypothetical protein
MSRRSALALFCLPACALLLLSAPAGTTVHSKDKPSLTVKVDCAKKESVGDALAQNQTAQSLVVEVSGLCHENVVVTRDRVTLRGADPSVDGIEAAESEEINDAAVWARGVHHLVIENLKLTGGFSGLLATDASLASLVLNNCRLEGNAAYGVQLQTSLVEAHDTTFGPNGNVNAALFGVSRLQCSNCTLADPQGGGPLGSLRLNLLAFGGHALFDHSTLTNGGIQNSDAALLSLTDSSLEGPAPNGQSLNTGGAVVSFVRVQVRGAMRFSQNSSTELLGVTQTPVTGGPTNTVEDSAFVRVGDAPPAAGGPPSLPSSLRAFTLRNFSNLSLLQTSQVVGNLRCSLGANAFCAAPATGVSGTSNCGLCPKP